MLHLWIRAEERPNERRTGVTPDGVAALRAAGLRVTVEDSAARILPTAAFAAAGAAIAPPGSWRDAPADAVILGLKELPEEDSPLIHRHIMFGHAFKGQPAGQRLLRRLRAGGGRLFDLEYLVDEHGRRVCAFGYWAGYVGAAVTLMCLAAQGRGALCPPVAPWSDRTALLEDLRALALPPARALIVGAQGRVGTGAADLCRALGIGLTLWDMAETAHGGPFPEILGHELFFNCVLATPATPVFVPASAARAPRRLRAIGDIACDPTSDFSPIKLHDRVTTWEAPALRVQADPPLDVMAIDNLPSLLPAESSDDFAAQLLPHLCALADGGLDRGVWARARHSFDTHLATVDHGSLQ